MSNLTESDPNSLYSLVELLGEGSYGCVYKGVSFETSDEVAVKIISYESAEEVETISGEIEFLKKLSSPYVVSYVASYKFANELWIIMEYCGGGSICDIFEARQHTLEEKYIQAVVAYTVLGLDHLHNQRCIHRDVKAGNILLNNAGQAKLADFGVSVQLTNLNQKRRTVIGTPYWMAPEVIQEISYDSKADIWSLGITILETAEGFPPFYDIHPMRAIFMIPSKPAPKLQVPEEWSEDMNDFMSRCLVKAPDGRWTSSDLLNHPWIRNEVNEAIDTGCIKCLRELIETNWDDIESARAARMSGVVAGKIGNQALRTRVKEQLDSTKLSLKRSGTFMRTGMQIEAPAPPTVHKSITNIHNQSISTSLSRSPSHKGTRKLPSGAYSDNPAIAMGYISSVSLSTTTAKAKVPWPPAPPPPPKTSIPSSPPLYRQQSEASQVNIERSGSDDSQYATMKRVAPPTKDFPSSHLSTVRGRPESSSYSTESNIPNILRSPTYNTVPDPEIITEFKDRATHRRVDPNVLYDFKQLLGEGSYGLVYKGECLPLAEDVAIKVLPCFDHESIGIEIEILKRLDNPCVVSFYQGFVYEKELWIVMEFCAGGSVSDIIRYGKKSLDEAEVIGIIASSVIALSYIHSSLCIHRDIKAGNILLTRDGKAKIADFGVSAQLANPTELRNTLIGTPFWMAPEVIQEKNYDYKVDVWGLGIALIEMVEGEPPNFEMHPMKAVFAIPMNPAPSFKDPGDWSAGMHEFLAKCCVKDPLQRASSEELLDHRWIHTTVQIVGLNKGLAKLREIVSVNWNSIEHFREQRYLKRDRLRNGADSQAPQALQIGNQFRFNDESSSSVVFTIAHSQSTDQRDEKIDTLGSIATAGKKWSDNRSIHQVVAVKKDLYAPPPAKIDSLAKHKIKTSSAAQTFQSVNNNKPKMITLGGRSEAGALLRSIIDAVHEESTIKLSKQQSIDNINLLKSQCDKDRERVVKAYEVAKSKRANYTSRSMVYNDTERSEIESKETESDMHEPSFGLRISSGGPRLTSFVEKDPVNSKGAAPMRDNPFSAFKILKYFRRHWKAQLISSEAKVNAINYKNIQNLEAVARMESTFHAENVFDQQYTKDLERLVIEYDTKITFLNKQLRQG